ncbi:MAG TPA: UDP-N-acetylglucosamine 1-carboxyvinyltransferase [Rhodospirillaceae bacterium]|nr:MAG: UDP-N-acetylglucosamine 1-carboxyvinyltransferase [Alphaproteobacteria bacterium GWF2_58_20]HAU29369.1 UDP-N-acetylglucosamine 1-carboxyvinyltransferase [Rhodospirillaceae bacterium]
MDQLRIVGGTPLSGTIRISGAKNAALPLMVASLLTDSPLVLENIPDLADIRTLSKLLASLGATISPEDMGEGAGRALSFHVPTITSTLAHYDLVRTMRASVLVLGPLLARCGTATVSLPGGCAIGTRPVDMHLKALEDMGATITIKDGYIKAEAPSGLSGARIIFPKVSVGATQNILMAATLAHGETLMENAAREPEIEDLASCLVSMGADISGIGTDTLRIQGKTALSGARHRVMPDRIEAGTYAMAAMATGGRITLEGARADHLQCALGKLVEAGADIEITADSITVGRTSGPLLGVDIMTEPYPGFPTDLQAQFMALMTLAEGASMITETIFENRFMHVPELMRMGADITIHQSSVLVRGVPKLSGAPVMATDLRASFSLVLAALAAEGETTIRRIYHLDRGYENVVEKLRGCGANIHRESDNQDTPDL